MINTYNESNLHLTLKRLYALEHNGRTEQAVGNWLCDIVTENGAVIEIQTASVSKLARKVVSLLAQGRAVTVVYPLATERTIETYDEDGALLSRRKSPNRATVYSLFRELTGMHTLLLRDGFTLEVLLVTLTEQRRRTAAPAQLENKSRRFLKNWLPQEKHLGSIIERRRFTTAADYLSLIPMTLAEPFTALELQTALWELPELQTLSKRNRERAAGQARLMLWLYTHMRLLEEAGKKGRSRLYRSITPICRS